MYTIKPLADEDWADWLDIDVEAFPAWYPSPEEKAAHLKIYKQEQIDNPQREYLGCYLDEKLVGSVRLIDFTMRVLSVKLPVIGIGGISVDMLHRKEHVAKETMAAGLRHIRDRGIHLSTLYAFRPDFYRKMGYGFGAKLEKYRIKPSSLPRGESKAHICRLTAKDRAALVACYHRYFDTTHGLFEKNDNDVDAVLCGDMYNTTIGYKKEGRVDGYVTYYINRKDDFQEQLLVREFVYNTPDALSELLTFLNSLSDQVHEIVLNTQDDQLYHILFSAPGSSDSFTKDGYFHLNSYRPYLRSNEAGVCCMYRVLNTPGIFKALKSHNFGHQTCRLNITIEDDFLPENNGSTIVHFENGVPHLSPNASYDVTISLDIASFSSLIMGVVTFKNLYNYGLATISPNDHIDTITRLFLTDTKPLWPQGH